MKLFESLKRLLGPRARPPLETVGTPTADRPPPPGPESLPEREPLPEPQLLREPASPDVTPAVADTSDVSEVRALLEAVAEAPEPAESNEPTPTLFDEATEEVVDVPGVAPQRIGDALVLTLATPPATFTVAKASATIGRGQENTIRLDDLSVSRRHARIAYKQGGYWLSDTGSMGGTWVDGTRLNAPYRIAPGQIIDIGLCRLTVSFAGDAEKQETTRKPSSEIAGQGRRRR